MFLRFTFCCRILLCLVVLSPVSAWAGTVVRVNSPVGEFFIEMFDETTPGTVENFLKYVNSGLYNGTIVHRLVPGFVIQGGWLTYNQSQQNFFSIPAYGNIQNEFRVSNQRGTIAMAKVAGDPHSANSQWFINLGNNSALDSNNGGFTVFGRVMGNGMQVVDAIAGLQPLYVWQNSDPLPSINYVNGPLLNSHLVNLNMSVAGRTDGLSAVFTPETSKLRSFVDAGELGLLSVEFDLISETPNLVIKLNPDALFQLETAVPNMAVFNNSNGQLSIPAIYVNGEVVWRNVRFQLTHAAAFEFTLTGLD